jgi:hypothetical protein
MTIAEFDGQQVLGHAVQREGRLRSLRPRAPASSGS